MIELAPHKCVSVSSDTFHELNMEKSYKLQTVTFENPRNGAVIQIASASDDAPEFKFEVGKYYKLLVDEEPVEYVEQDDEFIEDDDVDGDGY